ncbi:MAG: N-acetyl-gamma-glutamyl-phosphate reductase [Myxococcales bacterium]|nr:N-acetyl-gamma-glutamyl-phosphate reductase [Myxococcales bacterium]
MQERVRVAIIGGTGYGGAELIRLLINHPGARIVRVTSIDSVGEPLEAVHRNLHKTGLVFENIEPRAAAEGVDVVFLALPHKVSATLGETLAAVEARIIDLSGDFRLRDAAAYKTFYGDTHPHPQFLSDGSWTYGLPELNKAAIREARRVASPGCFATTIALGLLPLAGAGLLRGPVHTLGITGSSGSGAYASIGTHHPLRANNLKTYKVLNHQHTPEVEQTLRDGCAKGGHAPEFSLQFVPVSAPLARGILVNSFVPVPAEVDGARVAALFGEYYRDAPFVRVLGHKVQAEVVAVKGSMYVDLSWTLGPAVNGERQLVVTTALDNLVKGGAGQAVQSMNLMFGLPETQGIDAPGLWP